MSFVSWEFPAFFAAVVAGLALFRTREARHAFLLIASCFFYIRGTPVHLLVLAIPAVVDYWCALRMVAAVTPRQRRDWLLVSLSTNLGLLGYFKYSDFFIGSIASLIGIPAASLNLAGPIGISFFTFKTMSYSIDVYRGTLPACRRWRDYALFVAFFPELVSGPIVRASVFLPQLGRRLERSWSRAVSGGQQILLGFTKKLLVADRLALFVDPVFKSPSAYTGATVGAAVVAYSLQIYCDFSGYTDIAIGVARVIGFDLPENFNLPYLATSIIEFWRRWHITLSQWLRDYLYIPLGGNRGSPARTYANLMITMLLGGLWHGASWTFVAWGALHGVGLCVHRLVRDQTAAPQPTVARRVSGWACTYAFVCLGWILFRAPDFSTAVTVIAKVLGLRPGGVQWVFVPLLELLPLVVLAHIAGSRWKSTDSPLAHLFSRRWAFATGFVLTAWVVVLFLFAPIHTSPFIYFQF